MKKAAKYLMLTEKEFIAKYLKRTSSGYIHIVDKGSSCVFLKEKKCLINDVKPKQCATFPFWK
ncbi:MAG TPA: YkgJ family cysteine cluster protein, partial [Spirochaetota bacterium]